MCCRPVATINAMLVAAMAAQDLNFEAHFGGPDQPGSHLRDILAAHIDAVPAHGSIDWVTYYFRDRRLAHALLRAQQRGVRVTVTLSGHTRTSQANAAVMAILAGPDGLGTGLRLIALPGLPAVFGKGLRPRVHEKLYCFSHPRPTAFVGSFNPSSDLPELRPDIIDEIGDHDCAWNVLVGITEPTLVAGLLAHARRMHTDPPGLLYRCGAHANRVLAADDTRVYFWPRLRVHPVLAHLQALSNAAQVRIAASHVSAHRAIDALLELARRGVEVEIITEATLRRVTRAAERRLLEAGVRFSRLDSEDRVPMHLKFVLAEDGAHSWVAFGSFNWTVPSMYLNHEIAVLSSAPPLLAAFTSRWHSLQQALLPAAPAQNLSP